MGDAKGPDSNAYMVFNKEQSYYVTAKDSLENDVKKNEQKTYELHLSEIGIEGEVSVRDLWKHKDEGKVSKLSVELGPRACKVLKLTK